MALLSLAPYADGMSSGVSDELAALVALLQARPGDLSWSEITAALLEIGSAAEAWNRHAPPTALIELPESVTLDSAAASVKAWQARGIRLVSILDEDYPAELRGIHQAPPLIFALGSVLPNDPAIAVVGTRDPSRWGAAAARSTARALTSHGMTVVSGLARGVDTAAHRAALDAGGRTVAVLGTGISQAYPPENRDLQSEIAQRGLVLSQFWPDSGPDKRSFPTRNATMSGYGLATVVIEAGERSGARIQARIAVEHGRQVILTDRVVAQNAWAQDLLNRPGVHVASSVDQAMDIINGVVEMWNDIRRLVTP